MSIAWDFFFFAPPHFSLKQAQEEERLQKRERQRQMKKDLDEQV